MDRSPIAPLSTERLAALLDAYGADPGRWPADERAAAEALLAASPAARARRDEAARLDALLDLVPAPAPTADLADRIVVAARPRARRRLSRALIAAAPLAAAAALVVWIVRSTGTPGTPAPRDAVLAATDAFDDATVPTDELLAVTGLYGAEELPSLGCRTGELGCPQLVPSDGRRSEGRTSSRITA